MPDATDNAIGPTCPPSWRQPGTDTDTDTESDADRLVALNGDPEVMRHINGYRLTSLVWT
jgi:hypothetical protein